MIFYILSDTVIIIISTLRIISDQTANFVVAFLVIEKLHIIFYFLFIIYRLLHFYFKQSIQTVKLKFISNCRILYW